MKALKPQPRTFSKDPRRIVTQTEKTTGFEERPNKPLLEFEQDQSSTWWQRILFNEEEDGREISSRTGRFTISVGLEENELNKTNEESQLIEESKIVSPGLDLCLDRDLWDYWKTSLGEI
ncbi:hypothetical protein IFM89_007588 [Coptis chinensis]|uniref:Uncharacterized protein n=1 Tax=Coptis chinensis TaxID=261450 RepID=A0A835LD58_9MAGN|nr:hypothetical protein IFM89_007588 [Coptis chinensis]